MSPPETACASDDVTILEPLVPTIELNDSFQEPQVPHLAHGSREWFARRRWTDGHDEGTFANPRHASMASWCQ